VDAVEKPFLQRFLSAVFPSETFPFQLQILVVIFTATREKKLFAGEMKLRAYRGCYPPNLLRVPVMR
ncbi:MAG: hypothetical protein Q7S46_00650, partial [Gallionella sp.]|nr:hypothetical protein [Gallionella sp.]